SVTIGEDNPTCLLMNEPTRRARHFCVNSRESIGTEHNDERAQAEHCCQHCRNGSPPGHGSHLHLHAESAIHCIVMV
ncbi:MAG: hypothetical protein ACI83Y_001631, partial [Candidatus Azotimanducaceae bacterium]